jgi:aspartate/methionine/tyrosine aminotransferase
MRPYSHYLESVKKAKPIKAFVDLSGSTPPLPLNLPKSIEFDAGESRRADASRKVLSQLTALTGRTPLLTVGCSSAFLHALAAVTKPGDTVVIESPTYEPFVKTALFLGLKIKRFDRSDPSLNALPKGDVLVISNPNAPTGLLYTAARLKKLSALFEHVIIDEIFLPIFANEISRAPKSAIALSGLSKTLGLSSLRVGWIQAPDKILRACDQMSLNSYCDVPTLPLVAAALILPRFQDIVDAHRARVELNRPTLKRFHNAHPDLLSHDFSQGHFATLAIPEKFKTADDFANELLRKGIKVAPGESFDAPLAIRVSAFAEPAQLKRAFEIIGSYY